MTTTAPLSLPTPAYGGLGLGIMTGQEVASAVGVAAAKALPGGATKSNNKQPRGKKEDEANYTTIMLRNIPNKYSRQMLIEQLHNMGFLGQIDYLYLPIDFANRCNVGYCFINFRTPAARARFNSLFDNVPAQQCLPGFNSYKVCQVTKAKWQGRDENVRRIRSGPELMQQLAGHPDWLPVLLDEQGNQEPFLTEDVPGGKQALAQKGRNNKKQILTPGQLRPGVPQAPNLSDLLDGSGAGRGKKSGSAKAAPQGPAKGGKNAGGKNRGAKAGGAEATPAMAGMPLAAAQYQMQMLQAMAACNPMGGCGMPMGMMPGGVPMQGFPIMQHMQPMTPGYEGMDTAALMNMSMMPFAGGIDMNQYAAAMQMFSGQPTFPAFGGGDYEAGAQGDPRMAGQLGEDGDEEEGDDDDDEQA